jgi:hypothetical protein
VTISVLDAYVLSLVVVLYGVTGWIAVTWLKTRRERGRSEFDATRR